MRYEIWQPAGTISVPRKGEFPQKFAAGAFDGSIGKEVPLKVEGRQVGTGVLVAAKVADDGSGVTLTIETSVRLAPDPGNMRLLYLSLDLWPGPYGSIPQVAPSPQDT